MNPAPLSAAMDALGALLPLGALATAVPLDRAVLLACTLFAVGLVGVTCRRNVLVVLLSVEILLNAANLAFVAFSKVHGDVTGQVFVFFSMTVAAAEVAVGLAIVIALYRLRRTTDVAEVGDLGEVEQPVRPPLRLEGEDHAHAHPPEDPGEPGSEGHGPEGGDGHGGGDPHGHGTHGHGAHGHGAHGHDAHGQGAAVPAHAGGGH